MKDLDDNNNIMKNIHKKQHTHFLHHISLLF